MFRAALETGLIRTLTKRADHTVFPVIVAAVAFVATLSMTVPFAPLLAVAVLMVPNRWKSITVLSSLSAALGAGLLYLAFHHLGWAGLITSYPDVVRSRAWSDATRWLANYGVIALLVIAATPLPLTPVLMIASISRLPVMEVLLALWLGKLVKYTAYAWLVSAFPSQVLRHGHIRVAALHAALARAASPGAGKP